MQKQYRHGSRKVGDQPRQAAAVADITNNSKYFADVENPCSICNFGVHGTTGLEAQILAEFSVGRKAGRDAAGPVSDSTRGWIHFSQSQSPIRPDRLVQHPPAKIGQDDEPQTSHRAKKAIFRLNLWRNQHIKPGHPQIPGEYTPIRAKISTRLFDMASWGWFLQLAPLRHLGQSDPALLRNMSPVCLHSPDVALQHGAGALRAFSMDDIQTC
ncbi:hypothetical protein AJ78_05883 [Emergomyces pasteurianus Ep9510]|uniref:Uncharacterized protein n=1 Tax=Emergomyces pasteurianus Ep9510 TaxID=1447872 RepID=A0A1J9QCM2_9EURO|nr:hypothetical protein AJ78_05883 [Emergomyces pasteurianus Ep9510]